MADWELVMECANGRDRSRLQWLIRTLQRDPNVSDVDVVLSESRFGRRGTFARINVAFITGEEVPRGSTLHSLDHTHGRKVSEVTPPPKTWRLLDGV
jgi:hypothetical protein